MSLKVSCPGPSIPSSSQPPPSGQLSSPRPSSRCPSSPQAQGNAAGRDEVEPQEEPQ